MTSDTPSTATLLDRLARWFDRWVHPAVLAGSALGLHRARTQMVVAWIGAVVFSAGGVYGAVQEPRGAEVSLVFVYMLAALGCFLVVGLHRMTPRIDVSGTWLAFVSFAYASAILVLT